MVVPVKEQRDCIDPSPVPERIASGELQVDRDDAAVLRSAAQLGKLGGIARSKSLTPEQRAEIVRMVAAKIQ
jgi:hypothetical protein